MRAFSLGLFTLFALILAFANVWKAHFKPTSVLEAHVVRCFDGNTCRFDLAGLHPVLGSRVLVHFRALKTPRLRKPTLKDARNSRDALRRLLTQGKQVFLVHAKRKNGGLVADVCIDGADAAAVLVKRGLGAFSPHRLAPNCQRNLALVAFTAGLMRWLPDLQAAYLWMVAGVGLTLLFWRGAGGMLVVWAVKTALLMAKDGGGALSYPSTALKEVRSQKTKGVRGCFLSPPSAGAANMALKYLRAHGFYAGFKGNTLAVWWA